MANEHRQPRDYLFGTLSSAVALTDTSLSSSVFSALPTTYSSSIYLPLVLHNPSSFAYEVVWVSAHGSGSSTVTVLRGMEGTSAQTWPAGTQVVCAPTQRDGLYPVNTRSELPADAHVGMRAEVSSEGRVVQRVTNGWHTMSPIRFYAEQAGSQNVGSGAWAAITFTAEVKDTAGGHSTSSNTSRYVIPLTGSYELAGTGKVEANATGSRGAAFRVNGATDYTPYTETLTPATPGGSCAFNARTVQKELAAGDYVELVVWQNTGSTLSFTGCTFGVKYLGSD